MSAENMTSPMNPESPTFEQMTSTLHRAAVAITTLSDRNRNLTEENRTLKAQYAFQMSKIAADVSVLKDVLPPINAEPKHYQLQSRPPSYVSEVLDSINAHASVKTPSNSDSKLNEAEALLIGRKIIDFIALNDRVDEYSILQYDYFQIKSELPEDTEIDHDFDEQEFEALVNLCLDKAEELSEFHQALYNLVDVQNSVTDRRQGVAGHPLEECMTVPVINHPANNVQDDTNDNTRHNAFTPESKSVVGSEASGAISSTDSVTVSFVGPHRRPGYEPARAVSGGASKKVDNTQDTWRDDKEDVTFDDKASHQIEDDQEDGKVNKVGESDTSANAHDSAVEDDIGTPKGDSDPILVHGSARTGETTVSVPAEEQKATVEYTAIVSRKESPQEGAHHSAGPDFVSPDLAILEGLKVNKKAKILDEDGDVIGVLVEGDLTNCAGKKVNSKGEVVDPEGNVIGRVKATSQNPEDTTGGANNLGGLAEAVTTSSHSTAAKNEGITAKAIDIYSEAKKVID